MTNHKPTLWERLTGQTGQHAVPDTEGPKLSVALANPLLMANTERESRVVTQCRLMPPDRSAARRLPVNCALDIDQSSSMAGEKMQQAIEASCSLVGTMNEADRICVVAFNGRATPVIEPSSPSPSVITAIRGLRAGGGTNIGDGLDAGYARLNGSTQAQRRLILVSDGEPSVGECDEQRLTERAARARENGIVTSTLGVGRGYNEQLMVKVAEAGGGTHRFVDDPAALAAIFQGELFAAAYTCAADAVLTIRPTVGVIVSNAYPFAIQPATDGCSTVNIGRLDGGVSVDVFLDLLVPSRPPGRARIARGWIAYRDPATGVPKQTPPADLVVEFTTDAVTAARMANPDIMQRRQMCRAAGHVKTILDAGLTVQERTVRLAGVQKTLVESGLGGSELAGTLDQTIHELNGGVHGGAGQKTLVEQTHVASKGTVIF